MPGPWIDQEALKTKLASYFDHNQVSVADFGNKVNQTFEAFVFAAVVAWYKANGWRAQLKHPNKEGATGKTLRLKFSTRGRPGGYTYVSCTKKGDAVHIRHQLRVATFFHNEKNEFPANVCLDVAVIEPTDLEDYGTDDAVANGNLISFGEAKHMSAFAELVANFVGLVHEMQPDRLKPNGKSNGKHVPPFLYVSGNLFSTARGIWETIANRKYDIGLFYDTKGLSKAFSLPEPKPTVLPTDPPRTTKTERQEVDIPF